MTLLMAKTAIVSPGPVLLRLDDVLAPEDGALSLPDVFPDLVLVPEGGGDDGLDADGGEDGPEGFLGEELKLNITAAIRPATITR